MIHTVCKWNRLSRIILSRLKITGWANHSCRGV